MRQYFAWCRSSVTEHNCAIMIAVAEHCCLYSKLLLLLHLLPLLQCCWNARSYWRLIVALFAHGHLFIVVLTLYNAVTKWRSCYCHHPCHHITLRCCCRIDVDASKRVEMMSCFRACVDKSLILRRWWSCLVSCSFAAFIGAIDVSIMWSVLCHWW